MGIFNCSPTLAEAIDSIFAQSFTDWELIMCDDGSSDDTYQIALKYKEQFPDKIKLLKHENNQGLNITLNDCLAEATGDFIARMDGDDISLPTRLEKEIAFLQDNPEISIVSCPMIYFDENGDWGHGSCVAFPQPIDFVKCTPFCHAPCMVRKEAMEAVNGYSLNRHTVRVEDYNLWFRMYAKGLRGYNIQEPLYKMRDDQAAFHRRKFKYALNEAYVRLTGYRTLKLPVYTYIYALRPIIISLVPKFLYIKLHQGVKKKHDS